MVKECVHIDTGRYYAAKVINKRMMAGREHMVQADHGTMDSATTKADGGCDRFGTRSQY